MAQIGDFSPYYCAGVLFATTVAVIVSVALLTEKPQPAQTRGLTYAWLMSDARARAEVKASWSRSNKLFAFIILAGTAGMYLYFSFWL